MAARTEQSIADGHRDRGLERWEEDKEQDHTLWSLSGGSIADQGLWATGTTRDGRQIGFLRNPPPASNDQGLLPPPDPSLFVAWDLITLVRLRYPAGDASVTAAESGPVDGST